MATRFAGSVLILLLSGILSGQETLSQLEARAAALKARGDAAGALAAWEKAAEIAPRSARVQDEIGFLLAVLNRRQEAVSHFEHALKFDPRFASAHYHLGDAYNSVDDLPAALSAYETAAQLEPTNDRPLLRIGVVLDRMGRPAEAAAAYRRARAASGR